MATYFLDTSAIIKRYIFEPGQAWILSLCNPAQGHDLYISQAALVEVVAAICRRAREKSISMAERDRLITVFRQDSKQGYNIWPVTTDLYHAASLMRKPTSCAGDRSVSCPTQDITVLVSRLHASSADLTAVSTLPTRSLPPRRVFGSVLALASSPSL